MSPRSPGSPTAYFSNYRRSFAPLNEDEEVAAQLIPPRTFESYINLVAIDPPLNDEQYDVLRRVYNGESLFFTGPAGVGKSVLTREIIRALRWKYHAPNEVAVTASTALAATNVGGGTLHSWAGCGLAKLPADVLYSNMRVTEKTHDRKKAQYARWTDCKVLIIDEGRQGTDRELALLAV